MRFIRFLAGPAFIATGMLHFLRPNWYLKIMPPYIPAPELMVAASGAAEVAGGVGLLVPSAWIRRWSGWWLVATLVAVFPANIHMAINADDYREVPGGQAALIARLPVQLVFIRWVLAAARR
jgi:uncharacterized membrane protein